jgi:anti-sigma factor RsiW
MKGGPQPGRQLVRDLVEHLTRRQFEGYRRRQLEAAELLSVDDHLGVCAACRRLAEGVGEGDAAFFSLRAELFGGAAEGSPAEAVRSHLTAEQTAGYVDGALSGEALQTASDHLSCCEHCALSVADLRAFKEEVAPSLGHEYGPAAAPTSRVVSPANGGRWRGAFASLRALFRVSPLPAFGAALAVLVLTLFGWLVWRTTREVGPRQEVVVGPSSAPRPAPAAVTPTPPEPSPAPAQPEPAPAVAQLDDGGVRLALDRAGELSGAEALPPAYRKLLRDALAGRRIERSPQMKGLSRPGSSLMGEEAQGGEFSVRDPVASVLLTDRPTFRWSALEGADGYVVEVYDDAFNLVAASPQLSARSWASPQALARGRVYAWQVKALKDGQEVKTPRPPAPQAKFRVLDRAKADELARAKRAYPSSHLTLGLLYAEAGLLNEAEHELRLLQRANPDSDLARNLLRQVQELRRRSD